MQILADDSMQLTSSSSDFWILCAALKHFVANEGGGHLPLEV
jgi:amyloid beta precursor protein binding protein 1